MAPSFDIRHNSEHLVLGAQIVASMIVPILLGIFVVDPYLGTEPWGFVGGAVFGFVSVFYNIYKIMVTASQQSKYSNSQKSSKQNNEHTDQ